MSPRDLAYVGHMLDMAKKAISKTQSLSRGAYDADENLRFALIHSFRSSVKLVRLEFPIFSLNPGLRPRWLTPAV
jgi:hypothetical protein